MLHSNELFKNASIERLQKRAEAITRECEANAGDEGQIKVLVRAELGKIRQHGISVLFEMRGALAKIMEAHLSEYHSKDVSELWSAINDYAVWGGMEEDEFYSYCGVSNSRHSDDT